MSKSPRHRQQSDYSLRRLKYRKTSEAVVRLLKSHNKRIRVLTDFYDEEALQVLSLIISKASADLYTQALMKSRVSLYDGKIYDAYKAIMDCYHTVSRYYNENKEAVGCSKVQEILTGIDLILSTRMSELGGPLKANPIEKEKSDMLGEAIKLFFSDIEHMVKSGFENTLANIEKLAGEHKGPIAPAAAAEITSRIQALVIDSYMDGFYQIYSRRLSQALSALDNLEHRPALLNYRDALNQEYEILESVIKVQVDALEKEPCDETVVQKILSVIRETYQYAGKNLGEIGRLSSEAGEMDMPVPVAMEEFEGNIYKFLEVYQKNDETSSGKKGYHYNKLVAGYEKADKYLAHKLEAEYHRAVLQRAKHYGNNVNTTGDGYKLVYQNDKLSSAVISVFSAISEYTIAHKESYAPYDLAYQIINGILETIDIKIESLREAFEEYKAKALEILSQDSDKTDSSKVSPNSAGTIYAEWLDNFCGILDINGDNIDRAGQFINDFADEGAKHLADAAAKKALRTVEALHKADLAFKRESLLFEISTFEEIIIYSVSKLKENQAAEITLYINMIENADKEIRKALHQYGIQRITPLPHAVFNGKEHEVLMAEKREGFEKGHIIKVQNSGYRQGEQIIIRANVIAAK